MKRRSVLWILGFILCATVAEAQRAGVPVQTSWNYDAPVPVGATVTSFQLQRCTALCSVVCTPQDLSGATVGPSLRTITDSTVKAGLSYRYQLQAVGTANGQPSRSVATSQVCTYVKAAYRGRPVVTPDTR